MKRQISNSSLSPNALTALFCLLAGLAFGLCLAELPCPRCLSEDLIHYESMSFSCFGGRPDSADWHCNNCSLNFHRSFAAPVQILRAI